MLDVGEDEGGFGDVADGVRAGGDVLENPPALGEQGEAAFADAHHLTDPLGHLVSEVEQFFAVYKELEDSPTPTLAGRLGVDAVCKLLDGTSQ